MKVSRIFIALIFIGGLILMVSSNSMAASRFTIDKGNIENIVKLSTKGHDSGEYTEIAWKVKLQNNSDKPLAFDVTVTFENAEKDKLGETTKTCRIKAGESKIVSNLVLLNSALASQIDSGYVSIAQAENAVDVETHSFIATVDDSTKEKIADNSDTFIKIDYNVKLRNRSSKPVTPDLTVAFLDQDNVKISETRAKASFEAGETRTITDTIVLRASDASRISTGRVVIEK